MAAQELSFYTRVGNLPHFRDQRFVASAVKAYMQSYLGSRRQSGSIGVPSCEVEVAWRAHMLHPEKYRAETKGLLSKGVEQAALEAWTVHFDEGCALPWNNAQMMPRELMASLEGAEAFQQVMNLESCSAARPELYQVKTLAGCNRLVQQVASDESVWYHRRALFEEEVRRKGKLTRVERFTKVGKALGDAGLAARQVHAMCSQNPSDGAELLGNTSFVEVFHVGLSSQSVSSALATAFMVPSGHLPRCRAQVGAEVGGVVLQDSERAMYLCVHGQTVGMLVGRWEGLNLPVAAERFRNHQSLDTCKEPEYVATSPSHFNRRALSNDRPGIGRMKCFLVPLAGPRAGHRLSLTTSTNPHSFTVKLQPLNRADLKGTVEINTAGGSLQCPPSALLIGYLLGLAINTLQLILEPRLRLTDRNVQAYSDLENVKLRDISSGEWRRTDSNMDESTSLVRHREAMSSMRLRTYSTSGSMPSFAKHAATVSANGGLIAAVKSSGTLSSFGGTVFAMKSLAPQGPSTANGDEAELAAFESVRSVMPGDLDRADSFQSAVSFSSVSCEAGLEASLPSVQVEACRESQHLEAG